MLIAVIVVLRLKGGIHSLMEILDLYDRREQLPELVLSQHPQLLNGILDVGDILNEALDILLLPINNLQNVHLPLLQSLHPLLLQFIPPAYQLYPVDVTHE